MSELRNPKLTVIKDSYTSIEDALLYSHVAEKYATSIPSIQIKGTKFKDVQEYIEANYPDTVISHFPTTSTYESWAFEHDDFLLICESLNGKKYYGFDVYSKDFSTQKIWFDVLKSFEDKSADNYIGIYSYFISNNALKDSFSAKQVDDFGKLKSDYYPYLDVEEMFNQFLMSEDSMLVLTGLPGTGKTKMIDMFLNHLLTSNVMKEKLEMEKEKEKKKMLGKQDEEPEDIEEYIKMIETRINDMYDSDEIPVAYVKNEDILAMDEFWGRLNEGSYKLVILDDLDFALLPRTQQVNSNEDRAKNQFISQLLSYTDGIFEEGNNTKFIITTNRDVSEIDTAVLRKGRTFDILNLRYLTPVEAKTIWVDDYELSPESFDSQFEGLHEIPGSDIGAAAKDMLMAEQLGRTTKPYVLEDGISQYSTMKTSKKIGML